MNLQILTGPLVGSVIGYFTNYLAVKMLFHPRKEVKVFGHTLPFTPGVIPKGKPRLAKAIGEVVGKQLLTSEDISKNLLADQTKEMISEQIMSFLSQDIYLELTSLTKLEEDEYDNKKEKVVTMVTDQIVTSISELPIGAIIAEEGGKAIKEKFQGGFMAMMINDDLINSVTEPLGEKIQSYIEENGVTYVQPIVTDKITQLEQSTALQLFEAMEMDRIAVKTMIENIYTSLITEKAEKVMEHFDISKMIEDKINEMPVEDLENLVLSVMKKELDTIVNLGAVIGFLLGIINIFI